MVTGRWSPLLRSRLPLGFRPVHIETDFGMRVLRSTQSSYQGQSVAVEAAFAQDALFYVDGDNFADDKAAGRRIPEIENLPKFAFKADGRLGNLRRTDDLRRPLG